MQYLNLPVYAMLELIYVNPLTYYFILSAQYTYIKLMEMFHSNYLKNYHKT